MCWPPTSSHARRPRLPRGKLELDAGLTKQRRQASRELGAALDSDRYLTLLDRLDAGSQRPPFYPGKGGGKKHSRSGHPRADDRARVAVPALVASRWRSLRKKVRKAGSPPSDAELHRIPIGAKQLRYAAEAATPVMGRAAARTAARAEQLQTVLGEHHDAVTAEAWLREQAVHNTRAASFVAGMLAAQQIHPADGRCSAGGDRPGRTSTSRRPAPGSVEAVRGRPR